MPSVFDTEKCQVIQIHHPDCECEWCKAGVDERCSSYTVATLFDGKRKVMRVCDEHAIVFYLEADVYRVERDDGRQVLAS